MKAIAASSINQYEQAVLSLEEYQQTVQLGLIACFQQSNKSETIYKKTNNHLTKTAIKPSFGVIIFGSDQGLVGQFNDTLLTYMKNNIETDFSKALFWSVGERIQSRLIEEKLTSIRHFKLPRRLEVVTSLVTELLLEIEAQRALRTIDEVLVFFNHPTTKTNYAQTHQKLLPLDVQCQRDLISKSWPGRSLPQLVDGLKHTMASLIHEHLFISLYKACTASLASENASRLAAMQRAEKNIEELQDHLNRRYHQQRQDNVDEELFDLISGFEALGT
jgi:F-type H+-transporting ATPase subunit gamma